MLKVNSHDDIQRWWEVIDRTTGKVVPVTEWSYSEETGDVTIKPAKAFHDYTVSFLAYIMWDPVHMYNAVTNEDKRILQETSEKIPGEPSVCGCGSFHDIFPSVHTDL